MAFRPSFKLLTLGAAGVGGTGAAVWGLGSISSRNDTTYDEDDTSFLDAAIKRKDLPKEPTNDKDRKSRADRRWRAAESFFGVKTKEREAEIAKNWGDFLDIHNTNVYGASLIPDKAYAWSSYFGSLYTGCFKQIFPDAPFHDHKKFQIATSREEYNDTLAVPRPISADTGQVEGCFGMIITRHLNNFLLSSEIALKQGGRGVAIWTAVKNGNAHMPSSISEEFPVHARNFMVLLEKENGGEWKVKGGYSWGGRKKLFYTQKLKIKSFGGNEIDQDFHKRTGGYAKRDHRFYYSKWDSGYAGKDRPIQLKNGWYQDKQAHLTIIPNEIYGYDTADTFLDVENMTTAAQPWKYHSRKNRGEKWWHEDPHSISKEDINNIKDWLSPFTTADGAWIQQES